MSQLIHLKQRIKTIETIKKITHAMRLISISTHARLKNKEENITAYHTELVALFQTVKNQVPLWQNAYFNPISSSQATLYIVVGSQKGLCGTFNTMLFTFLKHYLHDNTHKPHHFIAVGKKASDFLKKNHVTSVIQSYNELTMRNIAEVAHNLAQNIITAPTPYTRVVVISNRFKSFFIQQPIATHIIPCNPAVIAGAPKPMLYDEQLWYQKPEELLHELAEQVVISSLHTILFQSLLAEQAARFLSMDNSTRNANSLLEVNKLQYNKLRQAKITKELAEFSGNL